MVSVILTASYLMMPKEPHLSLPTEYSFGPFPNRGQVEISVPLTNTGTAPLRILDVKSGCACLEHSIPEREIPAGETSEMTLTYNMAGKRIGEVREIMVLETNDPDNPSTMLSLMFLIEGQWSLLPKRLLFFGRRGERKEHIVTLIDAGDPDKKLLSIASQSRYIAAVLESREFFPTIGQTIYTIRITSDLSFAADHLSSQVEIKVDSPDVIDPITVDCEMFIDSSLLPA